MVAIEGKAVREQAAVRKPDFMINPINHVVGSFRRVAIIVPYYQREAEILHRCLESIFAQKTDPTIRMRVIIVDDTSPWPAKEELGDVRIPEQITVEVITRRNGGPGAARNSGLDHVSSATDFIAFIDSDDTWRDDHIQRAIDALGTSNDLYFSDYVRWEGFSNFVASEFGALVGRGSTSQALPGMNGVWVYANEDLIPHAVKEFLTHSSTLVFRQRALSTCRFDEELWYGEDYLFFFDLLNSSSRTCVSTESEVELGFARRRSFPAWLFCVGQCGQSSALDQSHWFDHVDKPDSPPTHAELVRRSTMIYTSIEVRFTGEKEVQDV
jgi:succinoglycan biosynthesis protein ExoW